jgi:hypothetical protein
VLLHIYESGIKLYCPPWALSYSLPCNPEYNRVRG